MDSNKDNININEFDDELDVQDFNWEDISGKQLTMDDLSSELYQLSSLDDAVEIPHVVVEQDNDPDISDLYSKDLTIIPYPVHSADSLIKSRAVAAAAIRSEQDKKVKLAKLADDKTIKDEQPVDLNFANNIKNTEADVQSMQGNVKQKSDNEFTAPVLSDDELFSDTVVSNSDETLSEFLNSVPDDSFSSDFVQTADSTTENTVIENKITAAPEEVASVPFVKKSAEIKEKTKIQLPDHSSDSLKKSRAIAAAALKSEKAKIAKLKKLRTVELIATKAAEKKIRTENAKKFSIKEVWKHTPAKIKTPINAAAAVALIMAVLFGIYYIKFINLIPEINGYIPAIMSPFNLPILIDMVLSGYDPFKIELYLMIFSVVIMLVLTLCIYSAKNLAAVLLVLLMVIASFVINIMYADSNLINYFVYGVAILVLMNAIYPAFKFGKIRRKAILKGKMPKYREILNKSRFWKKNVSSQSRFYVLITSVVSLIGVLIFADELIMPTAIVVICILFFKNHFAGFIFSFGAYYCLLDSIIIFNTSRKSLESILFYNIIIFVAIFILSIPTLKILFAFDRRWSVYKKARGVKPGRYITVSEFWQKYTPVSLKSMLNIGIFPIIAVSLVALIIGRNLLLPIGLVIFFIMFTIIYKSRAGIFGVLAATIWLEFLIIQESIIIKSSFLEDLAGDDIILLLSEYLWVLVPVCLAFFVLFQLIAVTRFHKMWKNY